MPCRRYWIVTMITVTDRGTMFGYQDMIVDFRGIPTMQYASTVLDVTHSLQQQPNQTAGVTGGRPDMIESQSRNCSRC
jgi:2-dehydro-3-deoxyphosphooctonate aldolase (KDO 8-P synthase)